MPWMVEVGGGGVGWALGICCVSIAKTLEKWCGNWFFPWEVGVQLAGRLMVLIVWGIVFASNKRIKNNRGSIFQLVLHRRRLTC